MEILSSIVQSKQEQQARIKQQPTLEPKKIVLKKIPSVLHQVKKVFSLKAIICLYKLIKQKYIKIFRKEQINGAASLIFNRRRYEQPIETLSLINDTNLGFTNNVLYQEDQKQIKFYCPVFVAIKVKNIQEISLHNLTGNINCVMIVHFYYGDIPAQIVNHLKTSILMQLNRGDAIKLIPDEVVITFKQDDKKKILTYTIRKVFAAQLYADIYWSPFQILDFVISLTFNTVSISKIQNKPTQNSSESIFDYKPYKSYKVSFNCMRNSEKIPISYALDCTFGDYDLAEKRLEIYYSKFGTYNQISRNFQVYLQNLQTKNQIKKEIKEHPEQHVQKVINNFIASIAQSSIKLSLRRSAIATKKKPKKVKYYQYTHIVVPLYKHPGNALATIFIPIFILALLGLAIFFQQTGLEGRIGSIATVTLGFIALVPSIKNQLPPSSRIIAVEIMVYIQTLCCILCLFDSFLDRNIDPKQFEFIWYTDITFLICLTVHLTIFLLVSSMLLLHHLKWEDEYNLNQKIPQNTPIDNRQLWDNPYCDNDFIKFNNDITKMEIPQKQKDQMLIKKYQKPNQNKSEKLEEKRDKSLKKMLSNLHLKEQYDINEFSSPSEELYFQHMKLEKQKHKKH